MNKLLIAVVAISILAGCTQTQTKQSAYPKMYGDEKPLSMLVVPAINESTAADSADLLNVTVAQPFVNHGYYVMSVPIVQDIFKKEGIVSGKQLMGRSTSMFKKNFGADSVLFLTIEHWDTNYMVIAGNVTVGIEYVLISTSTDEVLWSYEQKVVVDTGSNSGNIIADLIITAISTAVTDYVPVAAQVHNAAVKALPYGKYHPKNGKDGNEKSVETKKKEGALEVEA